jgi:PAS domain S-box-containing protein
VTARRIGVTAAAVGGFVAATVLLALYDIPGEPGGALLYAPFVALLAFEYGAFIGAVGGALSILLFFLAIEAAGGATTGVRVVGRGLPMIFLGAAIGWLSARLAEREASYRRIVDTAGEVIWVVDEHGILTFINDRARDVLGYEPSEMIGTRPTIQLEPAHVTAERVARRRAGESESYDLELRHRDGHSVWMHVIGTPMFDRAGRFVGGLGMASDITARKLVESQLAARERTLEEAQQLAHIGSWEWDIGENRVIWSDELFRIYGLEPHAFEASYQAFIERVHPDDQQRVNEAIQASYAGGSPFAFEHRIVRPDGEVRVLEARGTVHRDGGARPRRMAGTGHDITERKQAELGLAEARAELARHDLARRQATELNDTVVQALVLAKYALDRGDTEASARALESALAHARRMIDDLMGDEAVQPGQLRRAAPAEVGAEQEPAA